MKKLLFLIIGISTITSCNVVEDPFGDQEDVIPGPEQYNDTVYNDTTVTKRRILLEDFTGHKCPNCPAGADIAEKLKQDHPKDFVSVAIHNSGFFSRVDTTSKPSEPYPSDFETETGQLLLEKYKIQSFPAGLLNRSEINGSAIVDYRQWEVEVNNLLNTPAYMAPRFKIHLTNIYNSLAGNRTLRIKYKVEALVSLSGDYAIGAYLTESNIIAPQFDSRQSPSYVPDYEHNYVLRKGFPSNGQGKTIFSNPEVGEIAEVLAEPEELLTAIPDEWVPENMNVIVFIYSIDSGEVLGVEKMPLSNQ